MKPKPRGALARFAASIADAFALTSGRPEPCALADLAENTLGRVTGAIQPFEDRVIASPITGRPCVYYLVTFEATEGQRVKDEDGIPFLLVDGAARAVIEPDRTVKYWIDGGRSHVLRSLDEGNPYERGMCERWRVGRRYPVLFREVILGIGQQVSVLGAGTREPDPHAQPEGSYRGEVATRLRIARSRRVPMEIRVMTPLGPHGL